jgi:hypothetical protein
MAENSDSESSSYDSLSEHGQETDTSVSGNENEDTNTFISDNDDEGDDQNRLIPGCSDHHLQKACQKPFADRFEPVGLAGIGFFGVVLYAMIKFDSQLKDIRVIENAQGDDRGTSTRKLLAVKLCRPGCPSGIKDSARRLIVEIEAMKRVSQNITEPMRSCFAELHEYNTSNEPWYSMEPIMPGMTLDHVFEIISAATHPVPEGLAFHFADQVARAYRFLHEDCKLVRATLFTWPRQGWLYSIIQSSKKLGAFPKDVQAWNWTLLSKVSPTVSRAHLCQKPSGSSIWYT